MTKGIRTTIIGGLIFLIPMVFILIILSRAYELALKVATPVSKLVPIDRLGGVALANIVAIVFVVAICFCAGLMARSSLISSRVSKIDQFLTRAIPTYDTTKKGFIDSVGDKSFEDNWKVVLIGDVAGKRALGFEIERLENKDVIVFQPNTPNTKTGFVWSVPPDQVEILDINPRQLSAKLKSYGIGISTIA